MAGRGSRFANAGYKAPKPFIDVCGRPMIEVVVNNLRPKREHRFIFICQKDHLEKYKARELLESLTDNPIIIGIDGITEGQLCSALLARDYINNEDPVMTANTDQYLDFSVDAYLDEIDARGLDGMIMTMASDDPKWSYVKESTDSKLVTQTAEKQVISNIATVGVYNFSRGKDFVEAGEDLIANNIRVNNEFYICPIYNYLIAQGRKIGYYNIGGEGEGMYGLGIPTDLELFLKTDIAKQIRGI